MSEIARKQFKALVFSMRYDELQERMYSRLDSPQAIATQLQELKSAIEKEVQKEKGVAIFEYRQMLDRIPRLMHVLAVQEAQRGLD